MNKAKVVNFKLKKREDVINAFEIIRVLKVARADEEFVRIAKECNKILVHPVDFGYTESFNEEMELANRVVDKMDCEELIFDII